MDDLSELAEVSLTSVGKIERGAQSPSAETLVRLATALEIDAGSLISGLAAEDYGKSSRHYTARDFIREQRAKERAAHQGDEDPAGARPDSRRDGGHLDAPRRDGGRDGGRDGERDGERDGGRRDPRGESEREPRRGQRSARDEGEHPGGEARPSAG